MALSFNKIFAISDLHLSFSTPEKSMETFPLWQNYQDRIKANWEKEVGKDDLVLISGDISWGLKLKEALIDLEWIENLPGKKIILKGNHDYWWPSASKLKEALPPSISYIYNNAMSFGDISIGGTRLWDNPQFNFDEVVEFVYNPKKSQDTQQEIQNDLSEKIFEKEFLKLKLSLDQMDKNAKTKIVMTHYPPISFDLKDSKVSKLLEEHKINISIFGHLHSLKPMKKLFGEKNNIKYILTSADFLNFKPLQIL